MLPLSPEIGTPRAILAIGPDGSPQELVISFWPLVKRHNWTYRDLMAVARRALLAPKRYPLEREQDLPAYCQNVLGLRKPPGPSERSIPGGSPPGCEIALKLCPPPTGSS